MTEIILVFLFSPIFTAFASKSLLPNFSLAARLSLALPQVILFSVGAVLRAHFGFFSRWEYLMWFSVLVGPAIGFWLAPVIAKINPHPPVENA